MNKAAILGGGLCGSLLAVILARRGIGIDLLDRLPDPRVKGSSGGRSINLAMSARGLHALQYADILGVIEPLLVPMRGRFVHVDDGSTEFHAYGQFDDELIYSVSRAALNRALIDSADRFSNVQVRFQQEAIAYDPERATLKIRDHSVDEEHTLSAQPLLAADGAGSIVRRAYNGSDRIHTTEDLLAHGYKELSISAGPGGAFRLKSDALHIWPRGGFMLIALPNPGGDFTLTLFLPNEGPQSFSALENDKDVADFFAKHFPDVVDLIDDLTGTWASNPTGILGSVHTQPWHDSGDMLLLGDAAHAILPFHGQGMNLAFEDCVVLDEAIVAVITETANMTPGELRSEHWDEIFRRYEARQMGNANAIATMAQENYIEMRDTVRQPKHQLQKDLAFELERRLPQRFIPRYSMVMFHADIPYQAAQQRGNIQQELLECWTEHANSLDDIDLETAEAEAKEHLPPLPATG